MELECLRVQMNTLGPMWADVGSQTHHGSQSTVLLYLEYKVYCIANTQTSENFYLKHHCFLILLSPQIGNATFPHGNNRLQMGRVCPQLTRASLFQTVLSPIVVIHGPVWISRHLNSLLLMLWDLFSWAQARSAICHPMERTISSQNDPLQHQPLFGMESSQRCLLTLKGSPPTV